MKVFVRSQTGNKEHFQFPVQRIRDLKSPLCSNKYKAEQTENFTVLLRSIKEVRSRGKPPSPKLERRTSKHGESQLTS